MPTIAVIATDLDRTALGLPARLGDTLADRPVLEHTVRRAARIDHIEKIVLVHPAGQNPLSLLDPQTIDKPIASLPIEPTFSDARTRHWGAARKWALTCWRGGLGGATIYDEVLPAGPLLAAMNAHEATSAMLLRAEWCVFDDTLADAQLTQHLENPDAYKLCFTQAPPGLTGLVAVRDIIAQSAERHGAFAEALGYNPRRPTLDPVGRDVNIPIPSDVRDTFHRFVYDTPRSMALLQAIAAHLGPRLLEAQAQAITEAARAIERESADTRPPRLPQQVTVELTPRRAAVGPITPQHHVSFDRPDIDIELAKRVFEQLAAPQTGGDIALRLGGLGDALLHPQWDELVQAAHDAGVLGITIETDLLCDAPTLDRMLALPIDVICVRFNADTAETYRRVMGVDGFSTVANNLRHLMQHRNARWEAGAPRLPWIVPQLVKTPDTLKDMESFFDRWMMTEGQAVIQPAQSGCGLMPAQSPMVMAPPRRRPCRQLGERMTILSDGTVALCDQDWQGGHPLGDAKAASLLEIWQNVHDVARCHAEERIDELPLCSRCDEWHRP